jgi:hypothetical protein
VFAHLQVHSLRKVSTYLHHTTDIVSSSHLSPLGSFRIILRPLRNPIGIPYCEEETTAKTTRYGARYEIR